MLILDQVSNSPKPVFPLTLLNWIGVKLEIISHSNCLTPTILKRKPFLISTPLNPPWAPSTYLGTTVVPWKAKKESEGQQWGQLWAGSGRGQGEMKLKGTPMRGQRDDGSELSQDSHALYPTSGPAGSCFLNVFIVLHSTMDEDLGPQFKNQLKHPMAWRKSF